MQNKNIEPSAKKRLLRPHTVEVQQLAFSYYEKLTEELLKDPVVRADIAVLFAKRDHDRKFKKKWVEKQKDKSESGSGSGSGENSPKRVKYEDIKNKEEIYESYVKIGKLHTVAQKFNIGPYHVKKIIEEYSSRTN